MKYPKNFQKPQKKSQTPKQGETETKVLEMQQDEAVELNGLNEPSKPTCLRNFRCQKMFKLNANICK